MTMAAMARLKRPSFLAGLDRLDLDGAYPAWLPGVGGTALAIVLWQLIAGLPFVSGHILPTPLAIAMALYEARSVIALGLPRTLGTALAGWLIGNAIAVALALVSGLWGPMERTVSNLAVTFHALPTIALAPILVAVASSQSTGIILSALGVVFATVVGTLTGMRWPDPRLIEAVKVFGGGRANEVIKVRLPSALSGMFSGFLLGVPSAMVGALMAEYLLAGRGLGAAIIAAQEGLDVPRVWALCLCAATVSGLWFGLVQLARRVALPWLAEAAISYRSETRSDGPLISLVHGSIGALVFIAVACGLWWGGLILFKVTPYLGKSPLDVANYLFFLPQSGENRAEIVSALLPTLSTAAAGLATGTLAALSIVALFTLVPVLRRAFMPAILVFRSIPLLAMIPMVTVALGNGPAAVVVFTSLLAFFPTLVTVLAAMDALPRDMSNLCRAYNAGRLQMLWSVRVPAAIPAILQALRITASGAVLGAVVTEWLATTNGIGHLMLTAAVEARYAALWSAVVVITGLSLAIYALVVGLEQFVRRRLA